MGGKGVGGGPRREGLGEGTVGGKGDVEGPGVRE